MAETEIGKHYKYYYKGVRLDPYRILKVYKITDPAHQHAIKKLLRAGESVKDLVTDIEETIATLQRWLEMLKEDRPVVEVRINAAEVGADSELRRRIKESINECKPLAHPSEWKDLVYQSLGTGGALPARSTTTSNCLLPVEDD